MIKTCKICEKNFDSKRETWKTCSYLCSQKWRKEKWKSKIPPTKKESLVCSICSGLFFGTKSRKYCSKICVEKARKGYIDRLKIKKLKLRFFILQRDHFKCQYCGKNAKCNAILHIDHIIPKSKGGKNEEKNLITACSECNLGKGDVILNEYPD